ncbi:MAG: ABC transporter ATP-binding protein [Lachnospiraceae bacterium]|nr:ABC transporter ATP-binding protein [Lachnospiraceae bacterium]
MVGKEEMMSDPVLKLEDVTKAYGNHEVLKGVNMQVNRGDFYGLLGRNGAGKTTIFKMILGLSEVTSGTVSINGSVNRKELYKNREKIGFLVGTRFYGYLNAEKNLRYTAMAKGIPGREQKEEIERVLEIVGLKGEKKAVRKFSLGMQQRLGIANAIIGNPEILILDEPTNGLDPQGIADIRHLIQRLRDEYDMTVIVSSHILGELEHTADRFGIVNEGIVVKEITQQDLQENQPAVEIAVDDVARAKEVLEQNGIRIMREVIEKSSLEDYYFRLIGGGRE